MKLTNLIFAGLTLSLVACGGGGGGGEPAPADETTIPTTTADGTTPNTGNPPVSTRANLLYFSDGQLFGVDPTDVTNPVAITNGSVDDAWMISAYDVDSASMSFSNRRFAGFMFIMDGRFYIARTDDLGAYQQLSNITNAVFCRNRGYQMISLNGNAFLFYQQPISGDCNDILSGTRFVAVSTFMTDNTPPAIYTGTYKDIASNKYDNSTPESWLFQTSAGLEQFDSNFQNPVMIAATSSNVKIYRGTDMSTRLIVDDNSIAFLDLNTNRLSDPLFSTAETITDSIVAGDSLYFVVDNQAIYRLAITSDTSAEYIGTTPIINSNYGRALIGLVNGKLLYNFDLTGDSAVGYIDIQSGEVATIYVRPDGLSRNYVIITRNGYLMEAIYATQTTEPSIILHDLSGNVVAEYAGARLFNAFLDNYDASVGSFLIDEFALFINDGNGSEIRLYDVETLDTPSNEWTLPDGSFLFSPPWGENKSLLFSLAGLENDQTDLFFIDMTRLNSLVRITNDDKVEMSSPRL